MYTIRLDVKDSIFDKVMFLLNNLPENAVSLKVEKKTDDKNKQRSLVDFFRDSPLVGVVSLEKNEEQYQGRIEF